MVIKSSVGLFTTVVSAGILSGIVMLSVAIAVVSLSAFSSEFLASLFLARWMNEKILSKSRLNTTPTP